jgi:hypothetical protein
MITWKSYLAQPLSARDDYLYLELRKYFLKFIPEDCLDLHRLCAGEVPCFTRMHKKVFFIDKQSTTSNRTKNGFIRLTILKYGHTPLFVKEKVLKIIEENGLKKYQVMILYRDLYLAACVLHNRIPNK